MTAEAFCTATPRPPPTTTRASVARPCRAAAPLGGRRGREIRVRVRCKRSTRTGSAASTTCCATVRSFTARERRLFEQVAAPALSHHLPGLARLFTRLLRRSGRQRHLEPCRGVRYRFLAPVARGRNDGVGRTSRRGWTDRRRPAPGAYASPASTENACTGPSRCANASASSESSPGSTRQRIMRRRALSALRRRGVRPPGLPRATRHASPAPAERPAAACADRPRGIPARSVRSPTSLRAAGPVVTHSVGG